MRGDLFFEALGKKMGTETQAQLAKVIGVDGPRISSLKKKKLNEKTLAQLIVKQTKQIIDWPSLLLELKKKLGVTTEDQLAGRLGVSRQTLDNWRKKKGGINKAGVVNLVTKAALGAEKNAHAQALRPIIEFFPIDRQIKKKKYDVFYSGKDCGKLCEGLKGELVSSYGLYIFYDSLGRALYVGKAKDQSIWKEMNETFNRPRASQKISAVKHPKRNIDYKSASEKLRQPADTERKLTDIAAFFSAYAVAPALIDNFEALFIRAFPNDLLNFKIEKIKRRKASAAVRGSKKGKRRLVIGRSKKVLKRSGTKRR